MLHLLRLQTADTAGIYHGMHLVCICQMALFCIYPYGYVLLGARQGSIGFTHTHVMYTHTPMCQMEDV